MSFDEIIDRRGTHCAKWDKMEAAYGVSSDDGLAMWVADMDFRAPDGVLKAARDYADHGVYGYFGNDGPYLDAIRWWMSERHGWAVERDWIFTTHGLVNGTALCVDTWTKPGDGVVLFTPVYHAFARVIEAADRRVVECRMPVRNGRYAIDIESWDAQLDGSEKVLVLCSPHNPGGRVWTPSELLAIADFAERHNLILLSDEIHADLVFPGNTHTPLAVAAPHHLDRVVMMTSGSKTFNLAGAHIGNVIIPDPELRAVFARRMTGLGISPNAFAPRMITAAYSPEGAVWVDDLVAYIDGNRALFDEGVDAIPGLASMPLEGTYLSWVDFSGTGMTPKEFTARVEKNAKIAANYGNTFGSGGENFLRFNLATPRARVKDAVNRLKTAFADTR